MRLDAYLAQFWPETSRSQWQKRIKSGHVLVNGIPATDASQDLGEDDVVTPAEDHTTIEAVEFPILYEDDNVIVINKPAGVLTHAKGAAHEEFTIADFLRLRTADGLETNRPGIVHRLYRETSGVIIAAKHSEAKSYLQKQFQDRKAKKTYRALLHGVPKHIEANIELPIARNPKAPATFRVDPRGKYALTHYRVDRCDAKRSAVWLRPTTGRTHQLRVHMAYLGAPILGDVLYGGGKSPIGRLCLHAYSLEITLPDSRRMTFVADIPADMAQAIETIG